MQKLPFTWKGSGSLKRREHNITFFYLRSCDVCLLDIFVWKQQRWTNVIFIPICKLETNSRYSVKPYSHTTMSLLQALKLSAVLHSHSLWPAVLFHKWHDITHLQSHRDTLMCRQIGSMCFCSWVDELSDYLNGPSLQVSHPSALHTVVSLTQTLCHRLSVIFVLTLTCFWCPEWLIRQTGPVCPF